MMPSLCQAMKKGRTMAIGGMKRSESIQSAMCLPPRTSIRPRA